MPQRAILRGFEACFEACSHLLLVVALAVSLRLLGLQKLTLATFGGGVALRFCRWGFPVSDACLRELSCVVLRLVWRGDGFLRTNWPSLGRAPYTEPLAEELFSSPFAWGFHVARMSLHYPFGCWTRFPCRAAE